MQKLAGFVNHLGFLPTRLKTHSDGSDVAEIHKMALASSVKIGNCL